MTSPVDDRNTHIDGVRPVLFPVKTPTLVRDTSNTDRDRNDMTNGDPEAVRWVGMSPLRLVEMLASSTEQREASSGIAAHPLRVDGIGLSEPTPALPSDDGHVTKRRRDDEDDDAFLLSIESNAPPLPPWDPSFLLCYDVNALATVAHLQSLARSLESMTHYGKVMSSYRRVRDHLANTSGWIHSHCRPSSSVDGEPSEKARLLAILYEETIQKMEALIDMTEPLPSVMCAPDSVVSSVTVVKKAPVVGKQNFAAYMRQWLKNNWTNPYPDEDGLAEIASECDTTPTIVSNWLINARTRKWRPAIVKAFGMNRPADMLWEDSIKIFDGLPVREIEGYEAAQLQAPSTKRRKMH